MGFERKGGIIVDVSKGEIDEWKYDFNTTMKEDIWKDYLFHNDGDDMLLHISYR